VSAAISLSLGIYENPNTGWIEGTAILSAVALVVAVSSLNNYRQALQFRKLSEVSADVSHSVIRYLIPHSSVFHLAFVLTFVATTCRDGEQQSISVRDIVVGDILELAPGDSIPADGVIFSANSLRVDESSMTGESDSAFKSPHKSPLAISGCQVVEGNGKMIVTAVGKYSQRGQIRELLIKPPEQTPLQAKLEKVADVIGWIGIVVAVLTFGVLTLQTLRDTSDSSTSFTVASRLISHLVASITIVVVAVPEGLPLAVTLSLAYSMMKMLEDRNLVRHLDACETMGGATNICCDKTGTLTENMMTVSKLWVAGKTIDKTEEEGETKKEERGKQESKQSKEESKEERKEHSANSKLCSLLTEGVSISTRAYTTKVGGKRELLGSKTECAMLALIEKDFKCDFTQVRKECEVIASLPFSSDLKRSTTIVKTKEGTYRVFTIGAPEVIVPFCSQIAGEDREEGETLKCSDIDKVPTDLSSGGK
jgi:Ca2+-transporting ATPase